MLIPIFFLFVAAGTDAAQPTGPDRKTVSALLDRAKEQAREMNITENTFCDQGRKAAERAVREFSSPEIRSRHESERERLEKTFPGRFVPQKRRNGPTVARIGLENDLNASERVYLFLSSSVPESIVHGYIRAVAACGDPNLTLVMRGVVGGLDSRESIRFFSRILKKDLACRDRIGGGAYRECPRYKVPIRIAANLFTRYDITRVPAVVYTDGDRSLLIHGDAALDYLLERINREAGKASLARLIHKMRGSR